MVNAFGPTTSNNTATWHPEPNTRGTWSILSSCILTIALCAWTALHLNIPEHRKANKQKYRKLKWFIVGVVAPEVVAFIAWRQRRAALQIAKDVPNGYRGPTPSWIRRVLVALGLASPWSSNGMDDTREAMQHHERHLLPPRWTLAHGFYVVMGGFAFNVDSYAVRPYIPDKRTRAVITPAGFRFLQRVSPQTISFVEAADIKDKSKADGLKKLFVCMQALWFCVDSLARLAQQLPITLLELNAVAHGLCALLIYWMWWDKPLDIDEPTLIEHPDMDPICAYMWMGSVISAKGHKAYDMHGRVRDEFDAMWIYQDPKIEDLLVGRKQKDALSSTMSGSDHGSVDSASSSSDEDIFIYTRITRQNTTTRFTAKFIQWLHSSRLAQTLGIRFPSGLGVRHTAVEHLSPTTIDRWKLAHEAISQYRLEEDLRDRHNKRSTFYDQDSRVAARISNGDSLIGSKPVEVWLGFALAGLLYGGFHLLAWDAPFPSRAEQILWRISASSVAMAPLLAIPILLAFPISSNLVAQLRGRPDHDHVRGVKLSLHVLLTAIVAPIVPLSPLCWFLYVLGRVYLVVECFKGVGHLPPGAFVNVNWTSYFPHIS